MGDDWSEVAVAVPKRLRAPVLRAVHQSVSEERDLVDLIYQSLKRRLFIDEQVKFIQKPTYVGTVRGCHAKNASTSSTYSGTTPSPSDKENSRLTSYDVEFRTINESGADEKEPVKLVKNVPHGVIVRTYPCPTPDDLRKFIRAASRRSRTTNAWLVHDDLRDRYDIEDSVTSVYEDDRPEENGPVSSPGGKAKSQRTPQKAKKGVSAPRNSVKAETSKPDCITLSDGTESGTGISSADERVVNGWGTASSTEDDDLKEVGTSDSSDDGDDVPLVRLSDQGRSAMHTAKAKSQLQKQQEKALQQRDKPTQGTLNAWRLSGGTISKSKQRRQLAAQQFKMRMKREEEEKKRAMKEQLHYYQQEMAQRQKEELEKKKAEAMQQREKYAKQSDLDRLRRMRAEDTLLNDLKALPDPRPLKLPPKVDSSSFGPAAAVCQFVKAFWDLLTEGMTVDKSTSDLKAELTPEKLLQWLNNGCSGADRTGTLVLLLVRCILDDPAFQRQNHCGEKLSELSVDSLSSFELARLLLVQANKKSPKHDSTKMKNSARKPVKDPVDDAENEDCDGGTEESQQEVVDERLSSILCQWGDSGDLFSMCVSDQLQVLTALVDTLMAGPLVPGFIAQSAESAKAADRRVNELIVKRQQRIFAETKERESCGSTCVVFIDPNKRVDESSSTESDANATAEHKPGKASKGAGTLDHFFGSKKDVVKKETDKPDESNEKSKVDGDEAGAEVKKEDPMELETDTKPEIKSLVLEPNSTPEQNGTADSEGGSAADAVRARRLALADEKKRKIEQKEEIKRRAAAEAQERQRERELEKERSEIERAQKHRDKMVIRDAQVKRTIPLGTDRHHRRYWVFDGVPGVVVENNYAGDYSDYCTRAAGGTAAANSDSDVQEVVSSTEEEIDTLKSAVDFKNWTGPTPATSDKTQPTWHVYDASEEIIMQLLDALNVRGSREAPLRNQLRINSDKILKAIRDSLTDGCADKNNENDKNANDKNAIDSGEPADSKPDPDDTEDSKSKQDKEHHDDKKTDDVPGEVAETRVDSDKSSAIEQRNACLNVVKMRLNKLINRLSKVVVGTDKLLEDLVAADTVPSTANVLLAVAVALPAAHVDASGAFMHVGEDKRVSEEWRKNLDGCNSVAGAQLLTAIFENSINWTSIKKVRQLRHLRAARPTNQYQADATDSEGETEAKNEELQRQKAERTARRTRWLKRDENRVDSGDERQTDEDYHESEDEDNRPRKRKDGKRSDRRAAKRDEPDVEPAVQDAFSRICADRFVSQHLMTLPDDGQPRSSKRKRGQANGKSGPNDMSSIGNCLAEYKSPGKLFKDVRKVLAKVADSMSGNQRRVGQLSELSASLSAMEAEFGCTAEPITEEDECNGPPSNSRDTRANNGNAAKRVRRAAIEESGESENGSADGDSDGGRPRRRASGRIAGRKEKTPVEDAHSDKQSASESDAESPIGKRRTRQRKVEQEEEPSSRSRRSGSRHSTPAAVEQQPANSRKSAARRSSGRKAKTEKPKSDDEGSECEIELKPKDGSTVGDNSTVSDDVQRAYDALAHDRFVSRNLMDLSQKRSNRSSKAASTLSDLSKLSTKLHEFSKPSELFAVILEKVIPDARRAFEGDDRKLRGLDEFADGNLQKLLETYGD